MAKAKFSGCSVDVTPGGNVSFHCLVDPKSDCDFFDGKSEVEVPWDNCCHLGTFGFCESEDCRKNAVKQAKRALSKRS